MRLKSQFSIMYIIYIYYFKELRIRNNKKHENSLFFNDNKRFKIKFLY